MTIDPVCGMGVEEASVAAEVEYQGIRYCFCSDSCKEEFLRQPSSYTDEGQAETYV